METSEFPITQSYIQEEAQEILKIAFAQRQETEEMSREQLLETAAELGISPSELAVAEQQWRLQKQENQKKDQFSIERRRNLKQNFIRYAIVGSFLILINLVTTGGLSSALSILLFWGLFLALKTWKVSQTKGEEHDKAFKRWQLKKQLNQSIETLADKVKKGWET